VSVEGKRVVSTIERVFAKRVIATRDEVPTGALAREAFRALLARGSLFKDAVATTRVRLSRGALAAKLHGTAETPDLETWLAMRLEALGVESGDDLPMLSASDFVAPELPFEIASALDRDYPAEVSVGDATYRADYDLERREVVLHMVKGSRKDPPPLAYLPKFVGLRICVAGPRGTSVVRERGR
jgi:ATP-dependent helicase HrpB